MSSGVLPVKGLEGIIATKSSICWIDGEAGVLSYRGVDIHDLANIQISRRQPIFYGLELLPTASQLAEFSKELAAARTLNWRIYDFLRSVPTGIHADGGDAHGGEPAVAVRPGREGLVARGECAQELPADLADCNDRGHLRPHPQGQVDRRPGPQRWGTRQTF